MRSFSFDPKTRMGMLNGRTYYLRGTNLCVHRFADDPLRGDKIWDEEWCRSLFRC